MKGLIFGATATAVLFSILIYYLVLIAKYYNIKSGQGPKSKGVIFLIIIFVLGILLTPIKFTWPLLTFLSPLLLFIGSFGIISFSIKLYKSMMTIKRN